MTNEIVHIDLDDTICDYKNAWILAKQQNPLIAYPQSQEGFFLSLKPLDGAIDGIKFLQDNFEVYIATRPSYMNPNCYIEKRLWVEKYLGLETCKNLGLTPNKNLLLGDYLIDDVDVWTKFKGTHIHFGSQKYPTWEHVLKYFKTCL